MNVELTEERLKELMGACDATRNEAVCVSCGCSDRGGNTIRLVFVPQPQRTDGAFLAGLFTREAGRLCSVPDSPVMHVSAGDLTWFLPLVLSFLRVYSGEIPQEEAG